MFTLIKNAGIQPPWRVARYAVASLFSVAALLAPLSVSARLTPYTPPSTPGNFHVTADTESSISFAWNASKAGTDSKFVYVIEEVSPSDGFSFNVGDATSYTWAVGINPGETYGFEIFAIDSNNHSSGVSPIIEVTTPAPPPPPPIIPATPVITSVSTTPDTITVNWSEATPANEIYGFDVIVGTNGLYFYGGEFNETTNYSTTTSATIFNLDPLTTYPVTVVVGSTTGNSATSASTNVTTTISTNNIPPTAPGNLTGYSDGGGEAVISWNPSTSPYTASTNIEYRVFINGLFYLDSSTVGNTSTYVFPDGPGDPQPIYVEAVDQYGNVSPLSNTLSIDF